MRDNAVCPKSDCTYVTGLQCRSFSFRANNPANFSDSCNDNLKNSDWLNQIVGEWVKLKRNSDLLL